MTCVRFSTLAFAGAASLAVAGAAAAQPSDNDDRWGGIYAGLNTGWNGWSSETFPSAVTVNQLSPINNGAEARIVTPTTFFTPSFQNDTSRWTWGGQVGINFQSGNIVYGLEGDANALYGARSVTGVFTLPPAGAVTGSTVTVARSADPRWMATLRGRVGWSFERVLLYATGGVAWARLREGGFYTYTPTDPTIQPGGPLLPADVRLLTPGTALGPITSATTITNTRVGWIVGGGAEWKVWRSVTIGLEYKHSDFGRKTFALGSHLPGGVFESPSTGFTDDMVTAKVNYRFWGPLF